MNIFCSPLTFFYLTIAPALESTAELGWQLAAIAIGVVLLSIGLAGLCLFFMRRKTGDRSLVFFSFFSLLYAIRLIHGQSFMHTLLPGWTGLWKYFDLVLECFIVVPLTLFLIEIVQTPWKTVLRWVVPTENSASR